MISRTKYELPWLLNLSVDFQTKEEELNLALLLVSDFFQIFQQCMDEVDHADHFQSFFGGGK